MATLSDLQTAVLSNLGLATGDVTLADVTRRINHVYQYDLPHNIGGVNHIGEWLITTTSTDDGSYQFENRVQALTGVVVKDDDLPLRVWTDYGQFWTQFEREDTDRGEPTDALIWGRELILRPLPDGDYDIYCDAIIYRDALATTASLIVDPMEEHAIEFGATMLFAAQQGMDDIAARYAELYNRELRMLSRQNARQYRATPIAKDF